MCVVDAQGPLLYENGADVAECSFSIPSWTKESIVVSAVLRYRKSNNRYARWALKDNEMRLPVVDVARDSITVPVRIKPEIYGAVRP